jgi:hypothetical protein
MTEYHPFRDMVALLGEGCNPCWRSILPRAATVVGVPSGDSGYSRRQPFIKEL